MKKGFTLIELLVVVLIIGILAAVALPQYTKAVEKARATEAKTLLGNILTAEQIYKMAQGTYTSDLSALDIQLPGVGSTQTNTFSTKNFGFTVLAVGSAAQSASVSAIAGRITASGANATGDLDYSLRLNVGADGKVSRRCFGSASTCKSICNGVVCGILDTTEEWCYVDQAALENMPR